MKVTLEGVTRRYGKVTAVDNLDLEVHSGEFLTLVGPSGCGKTTVLKMIAGLTPPSAGRIRFGGEIMDDPGNGILVPAESRELGMVFQSYALWPHLTVQRNCSLGLEARGMPREQTARQVAETLELVGLSAYAARYPHELSGGQQQRVALARAIALKPRLLLFDEPLSNLDAKLRVHMRGEILSLQRRLGTTSIFVTHDQEEALSIADRVAVLDSGVIQQIGTPMELYDRPANRFIANFIGTINLLKGQVTGTGKQAMFESPVIGRIPLPSGEATTGEAELAIRPHALALAAPEEAIDQSARVWIDGTVAHREFLGEFIRYSVQVGDVALIVDAPHYGGDPAHEPKARVKVGIDPAQVRLLAA